MFALMSRSYYWPQMRDDVELCVKTCLVCQQDKVEQWREVRLLQPLPIPNRPWASVSMDFLGGFPKVEGMLCSLLCHAPAQQTLLPGSSLQM